MSSPSPSRRRLPAAGPWAGLGALGLLALAVVWRAPAEQTLGDGIRWVYLHVALTWTGLTALLAAGLLGAALLGTGRPGLQGWTITTGRVGLGFFAAGLAMSTVAASVNWGGMFWDEPRTRVNLQVLAAGVIVAVAAPWLGRPRWQGLSFALLSVWMVVSLALTPLILHPRSPIMSSSSTAIRSTFLTLFLLCGLTAISLIVHFRPRGAERPAAVSEAPG